MADFNRYVVEVEVTSGGADYTHVDECSFSVAAVSEGAVRSALGLDQIAHVHEYEITNIKKQND